MAHQRRLVQIANDMAAATLHACQTRGYDEQSERLLTVGMIFGELAEMGERAELSIRTHGKINDTTWRYIRENMRDLAVNVCGCADVPLLAEATAVVAD
jgi:hypothetical protein